MANKPTKGTQKFCQKYYFRSEITVWLEFIYINSLTLTLCWVNLNLWKGDHDQGENIADNGGSKVKFLCHLVSKKPIPYQAAYRAYKKLPTAQKECVPGFNFTSDQLFWVRLIIKGSYHISAGSRFWLVHVGLSGCQLWRSSWPRFAGRQSSH